MSSVLRCFGVDDLEDSAHPNNSICHCICLRWLTQQLIHVCIALFRRGQVHAIPSSTEGTVPLTSAATVADDSPPNTYHSPPRPLPYDDPTCSRQRDGFVSRHSKCSSHSHEESELLRRSCNENEMETPITEDKRGEFTYARGVKLCCPDSSLEHSPTDVTSGPMYYLSSSEEEDVCPTCLEEYTSENPKITLKCTHHFHLGCIYEWMERSEACPVCGKE